MNFRLWRKKSNLKIPLDTILITVYSRLINLDITNYIFPNVLALLERDDNDESE